jgi:hypothetical protein
MGPAPNIFVAMLIDAYRHRHAEVGGLLPAEHPAPELKKARLTDATQSRARARKTRGEV